MNRENRILYIFAASIGQWMVGYGFGHIQIHDAPLAYPTALLIPILILFLIPKQK
jgi:hypothetical protein